MTLEIKSSGERFEELVKAVSDAGDDQGLRSTAIQDLREYHTDLASNEVAFSNELKTIEERNENLVTSNEFLTGRLAQQPLTNPQNNTQQKTEVKSTTEGLSINDLF